MATGDLGPIVDTLEFAPVNGMIPKIIHIAGSVYAIVYQGVDDDGFLITITISAAGAIGAVIDTYEFDPSFCITQSIFHISGTTYAIAYQYVSGGAPRVVTVTIANDGTITHSIIDSLVFAALGYSPRVIHVSGDIYAIVYTGADNDGYVCTVSIEADGDIGAAVIETLEFAPGNGQNPVIIHVSGDVFAIAHYQPDPPTMYGYVKTLTIDSFGNIGAVIDDQIQSGVDSELIHISGSVYASLYTYAPNTHGWIRTVNISDAGVIAGIDLWEFEGDFGRGPKFLHVSGDVYLVAYWHFDVPPPAYLTTGYLFTLHVADDGTITHSRIDTLVYDSGGSAAFYNDIIHIAGNVYAVCYTGQDNDGFLKTFDCETVSLPTVTTDAASSNKKTQATPNGTLDNDGGETCDCGFEWGETIAYGNTTPTQSRTSGQTFAQTITGLKPKKTYHFRAFATNSVGTGYGGHMTFVTRARKRGLIPALAEP